MIESMRPALIRRTYPLTIDLDNNFLLSNAIRIRDILERDNSLD
jgi:hypothetical protein